ncbi:MULTISPECIES: hypothetical protein [Arthrobacter]|nr:hypothetical protein [Arthrobacter citreus]
MSNTPARTRRSVFFLVPLGALAGMALALLNFQLNYASSVGSEELASYILWTMIGGAGLGGSFACPASVAAYASASSGKSPGFCAGAAGAALAVCWLLYAAVSASGGTPVTWLLPAAAALTTAGGAWFAWFIVHRLAPGHKARKTGD